MRCTICNKPLTGKLDTYGDVGQEVCWTCWCENQTEGFSWYGLFPGGDPRYFTPDYEVCERTVIEQWRRDCQSWEVGANHYVSPHSYGPGIVHS